MACDVKCAKYFIFVVNALVWLVGAAFLAIGIWVAVSPTTFVNQALVVINISTQSNQQSVALAQAVLSNNSMLLIGSYIMIAVGGFLFLVGFCGCCGACKDNKCLLIIYIIFAVIAFCVTLAGGIVEAVYLSQINAYLTTGFIALQNTNFDANYSSLNPLSEFWYSLMQTTQCCGIYGTGDFSTNASSMAAYFNNNNRQTCAGNGQCFSNAMVPASCCALNATGSYMLVNTACVTSGTGAYTTSCQSTFITPFANQIKTYATIVMGVTFGLAAFCLLAVAAAGTMLHHKRGGHGGERYA